MKIPFDFSISFVFRLVFPGIVLSVALLPAIQTILAAVWHPVAWTTVLPVNAVVFGWVIVLCDQQIYTIYEGRRYWPNVFRTLGLHCENYRLRKLLANVTPEARGIHYDRYIESMAQLVNFPLGDDGNRKVIYPTRLGNLLASSESLPSRYYGADAMFYWYRLWVMLDKDLRTDIDNAQALSDSAIYVSFTFAISAVVYFIYALVEGTTGNGDPFLNIVYIQSPLVAILLGMGSAMLSYLIYRAGLPSQVQFGELFNSVFDQYRDKLSFVDGVAQLAMRLGNEATPVAGDQREKYRVASRLLRFNLIWPSGQERTYTPEEWEDRQAHLNSSMNGNSDYDGTSG
jgi:hypothetical protein